MGAFEQVHILRDREEGGSGPLVVAETGCKSGDVVRKTMAAGLTVLLGARPSVGSGRWLQGGIGHLAGPASRQFYGISYQQQLQ
ncbi:hypothetical protein E5D57_013245 [Metarhizium anisopliae]|nr:hypothetical protein E5D57_013245 [Metarhizium anisopliae]